MALCYHCFREKGAETVCPFCGYDPTGSAKKHPMALRPESILNGRYILGRVLGQGGFGITYIAQDYQTKERVAVKEYFPTEFAGRTNGTHVQIYSEEREAGFAYGKAQFLEEARTLAAVTGSENIVRIHSYFEENGTAYFTMDYVEGLPLDEYLKTRGAHLKAAEAAALLLPLMGALDTVHRKGIVHRDIAPDNIIISPEGKARLIDFGAARYSTGEKSKSLDVILKHGFAPMEQYTRRGRQGPWTDVYAMAATYYFALTGKVPPDAIERIAEDTLEPPSALGSDISVGEEQVLLKGLAVQASERWQTMGEFRAALLAVRGAIDAETRRAEQERKTREERERKAREKAEREKQEKAQREAQKKAEQEAARVARQAEREAAHTARQAEREAKKGTGAKKSKLPLVLAAVLVLALVVFGVTRLTGKSAPAVTAAPTATAAAAEPAEESVSAAEPAAEAPAVEAPAALAELAPGTYKIGVAFCQFDGSFMTLYRNELLDCFKALETDDVKFDVTIVDGKNDMDEQNHQIDEFIALGMDAIVLNLVETSAADAAIDKIAAAGIPCILINREPLGENGYESYAGLLDNDKVCYVGADPLQAGTFQAEIIRDLDNHGDINGDGVVSILPLFNFNSDYDLHLFEYTFQVLDILGIAPSMQIFDLPDGSRANAQSICANALAQSDDAMIEVVLCGSDDMALGAAAAITAAGRTVGKDIYLIGCDALEECVEMVSEGTMTGTVLTDYVGQTHTAVDVTITALAGQAIDNYYRVDCMKITASSSTASAAEAEAAPGSSAAPAENQLLFADPALAPAHPTTPFGLLYKDSADRGVGYTLDEVREAEVRTARMLDESQQRVWLNDGFQGNSLMCLFMDDMLVFVNLMERVGDSSHRRASLTFWGENVINTWVEDSTYDFFVNSPAEVYAAALAARGNPSATSFEWTVLNRTDLPFHYHEKDPLELSFGFDQIGATTSYELDSPVTDLDGQTLYMQMTLDNCPSDYPFGEHMLLGRGQDGNWVTIGTFKVVKEQADGRKVLYKFTFPGELTELAAFAGPFPMDGPLVSGYSRNTSFFIAAPA